MATSVEERHINDDDCRFFFFCDDTPLFENFRVISAETVKPNEPFNDNARGGVNNAELCESNPLEWILATEKIQEAVHDTLEKEI